MLEIENHPNRIELANELHARPFPVVNAPANAVFFAIKPLENIAYKGLTAEREFLLKGLGLWCDGQDF